ncbi:MAG: ATP-binding protein [Terracidiphilus sp.]|nr:ATP-binding protein [Terracidiphilus sp.]
METNLFNRLQAIVLAVATAGLIALAVLNLRQESEFQQPDDGVWWREVQGGVEAVKVLPNSPAERAGIREHDLLTGAEVMPDTAPQRPEMQTQDLLGAEKPLAKNPAQKAEIQAHSQIPPREPMPKSTIVHLADLEHVLYRTGIYGKASYAITRDGIPLDTPVVVIPEPLDRGLAQAQRIIGLVYLGIGIYVLFRRWTAARATHFYLFCLVSFALCTLKYTGELNWLDWTVFWLNVAAESLQPALFLHFALSFPEERFKKIRRRWLLPLIYAPGAGLLGLWLWAIQTRQATGLLKHRLDQTGTGYDVLFYVLAALLFLRSYKKADTPLLRQQLKWVTRGTLLAVLPFTLFSAVPFLLDLRPPRLLTDLAGLSLVFLPLTFSWAIVRYRLMDTDLIFKRGVAYTLATGLILGGYFGVIAAAAGLAHNQLPVPVRDWGEGIAIVLALAFFEPLKRRIQGWVDRAFDRHRYDYRKALVEFGRGLSSETDLEALLESIVERLPRTLLVARVAVFVMQDSGRLRLAAAHGLPAEVTRAQERDGLAPLALGFLNFDQTQDHSHIFLENAQAALHLPEEQQRTAALLDLNYYLPCRVQDGAAARTFAVIGLGRTIGGDFLSSEDVELLESLASYIGIALQNASLYARLEAKIGEFERLKEFNENIVESINVGILALDLDDRVESWNAQMEAMYALSRAEALGQELRSVFPSDFVDAIDSFRSEQGVHHLYKFRLTTRAGEQRTVNIAIAPLLSRDFVSVGRIILVDDITERVSLESQLAQADKLSSIGLLAAGVAHEINTPLAVISSYAQMLSKQLKADPRLGPVLDKITQQSFRAAEIANGLLNFSRTSTTEFRETNLNQVIRDTLSLLEHQFKTAQIHVDLDLVEELPAIHGNPGKLQQVFLNLLLNAKEAMPEGGRLRVSTAVNGHVEAIVTDSGSGIAPEHLKRIYDPFFTTKITPRPGDRRGTGLGLSVSYGIIQEHAGKIHVESAVGAGTTFHLEFPLLRNSVHA